MCYFLLLLLTIVLVWDNRSGMDRILGVGHAYAFQFMLLVCYVFNDFPFGAILLIVHGFLAFYLIYRGVKEAQMKQQESANSKDIKHQIEQIFNHKK